MFIDFDPMSHYWIAENHPGEVYSSARAVFVAEDDAAYVAWLASDGHQPSRVTDEAELVGALRRHGVPPYHRVFTFTVVQRLAAVGKLEAAEAAISADLSAKWRFTVATGIDADDVETRGLLAAIGADPDVILAPE